MGTISRLSVSLTANTTKLQKGLKGAKASVKRFSDQVFSLKGAIAGAIGVGSFAGMLSSVVQTNKEMQTLKASLKTVTGSTEGAAEAFERIKKFAITTPFDLQEWTQGFIKMKSLGLDPSEKALTAYGNTAAAMGKSLNQMVEAVADAATGEFERLKEFGIKARKQGEDVSFTFQGVTTTVKNNAKEIEGYLQGIGNNQFGSAMADQMGNLGPAFSNLGQAFTDLSVMIGEAGLNTAITQLTTGITNFVNEFDSTKLLTITNFFKSVGEVISPVIDEIGRFIDGIAAITMMYNKAFGVQSTFETTVKVSNEYQLGDFNRSNGMLDYLETLRAADLKNDPNGETVKAMEENNAYQAQILDAIRENQNLAVAG
jgi:phage tail tape-measure protein